jgi:uncharacterized protein (DUF1330 family)
MKKAYLILDFKITDMAAFMEYVEKIPFFIQKHSGKYIVEGVKPTIIEGVWRPDTIVVLEFTSKVNAENFLADPEIQELFKVRHKTTNSNLVLVEGGSWRDAFNESG